jgi:hypothetical protein
MGTGVDCHGTIRMRQPQRKRNVKMLWALLVFALAYGGWMLARLPLTGRARLDGAAGVLLGLFISSKAAANLLDLVLFGNSLRPKGWTRRTEHFWVALNALILLIGCTIIVVGTTRFTVSAA